MFYVQAQRIYGLNFKQDPDLRWQTQLDSHVLQYLDLQLWTEQNTSVYTEELKYSGPQVKTMGITNVMHQDTREDHGLLAAC